MKALQNTILRATGLAALLAFLAPAPLAAPFPWDDDEDKDKEEEEEAEEEEDKDRWYAIRGGDVYTGTGAVLRGATVLSKNGKIEEIGYDLYLPEETEVLDATGYRVYPGLVAVQGTTRISRGLFAAEFAAEPSLEHSHDHGHGDDGEDPHATDPLHPDDDWEEAAKRAFADDESTPGGADGPSAADEQVAADRDDRPEFEHSFDPFSS